VKGVLSFEEGFGDTSLVTNNSINHFDFLAISSFDFLGLGGDDFNVDVVSASNLF
jgi:hypothetical protein